MAKIQKTFRIDRDLASRVEAQKTNDETITATYYRILEAGLDAIEGGNQGEPVRREAAASSATQDTLIATLATQLDRKDKQIKELLKLARKGGK